MNKNNDQTAAKNSPLVVERTFDAPVALVWRALTEVDDIKHWFVDLNEFEARAGCEFKFHGRGQGWSISTAAR